MYLVRGRLIMDITYYKRKINVPQETRKKAHVCAPAHVEPHTCTLNYKDSLDDDVVRRLLVVNNLSNLAICEPHLLVYIDPPWFRKFNTHYCS